MYIPTFHSANNLLLVLRPRQVLRPDARMTSSVRYCEQEIEMDLGNLHHEPFEEIENT